tara:strand:- start:404 stop:967 length:564 start_codon:yes stop_codon:yes gene_type:complete
MCDANPVKAVTSVVRGVSNLANDAVEYGAKKVKNTVKDVSGYTAKENQVKEEFKRKQAEAERIAAERQAELDRLASVREAQATEQRNRMTVLMQRQKETQAAQQEEVTELQEKQATQLAQLEKEQLATTAAGASLRVLAKQKTGQAPTAKLSGRRKSRANAAYRSPTSQLSVGSSGRDAGVGVNLGG